MVTQFDTRVIKAGRNQGARFAIFQLEDFTGRVKCVLWSDQFARYKDEVAEDRVLLFEGHVEWRAGSSEPDVIVEKVMTLDQAKRDLTKEMVIRLPYGEDEETLGKIDRLKAILPNYRGPCPVWLLVRDPAGRLARLKLAGDYWVNPATLKMEELDRFLGPGAALFNGR